MADFADVGAKDLHRPIKTFRLEGIPPGEMAME